MPPVQQDDDRSRAKRKPRRMRRGHRIALIGVAVALVTGVAGAVPAYIALVSDGEEEAAVTAADSAQANQNELLANARWPALGSCDAATEVAVLDGGPSPTSIHLAADTDPRASIVDAGGWAWGRGSLTLILSTGGDSVAAITDIRPVVYRALAADPIWVYVPEGGCGDIYERVFHLDLDTNTLVDRGVVGTDHQSGEIPPSAGLGSTFTVSRVDPAKVVVYATACEGAYEWGLEISYVIDGAEYHLSIGTADQPFRSAGSRTAEPPTFSSETPTRLRETIMPSLACKS